jgi:hypothetical protein
VATALLADLVERGLPTERAMLFVIDGAKALRKAVREVFGDLALVQRCQQPKGPRRNNSIRFVVTVSLTLGAR